jgi:ribonuclease-3
VHEEGNSPCQAPRPAAAHYLSQLAQITTEIAGDQELANGCRAIAGDEVVSAALSLAGLFRSKQSRVELATSIVPPTVPTAPKQIPYYKREPTNLPNLPPILDQTLSETPFIHRWIAAEHGSAVSADGSYERLEFIGDAYIELIASRFIYPLFPQMPPGRLSQLRELLVKNETLAQFAMAYKFDERAKIPPSLKDGGATRLKQWNKTLGDMFEAYVAALILSDPENGFRTAETWLVQLWTPKLPSAETHDPPENTMAKQDLARKIQSRGTRIEYRDEARADVRKEGKTWYTVGAYFTGWDWKDCHLGSGKALNKSEAGTRAAMQALLNPLTAQIGASKRDFDMQAKMSQDHQGSGSKIKGQG